MVYVKDTIYLALLEFADFKFANLSFYYWKSGNFGFVLNLSEYLKFSCF